MTTQPPTNTPAPAPTPATAPPRSFWVRAASWPFIGLVKLYQITLSPWFGGHCRFMPTCSAYAIEAFSTHNPLRAAWLTVARLARCHPLCKAGYDPVPLPRRK